MEIQLIPLTKNDPELEEMRRIHTKPSVSETVPISDSYFGYVTSARGVVYYKVRAGNTLIGGIHSETIGTTLWLSIFIDEPYRQCGYGEQALKTLFSSLPHAVKTIESRIQETNTASIHLFEKLGFLRVNHADSHYTYRLSLERSHPSYSHF